MNLATSPWRAAPLLTANSGTLPALRPGITAAEAFAALTGLGLAAVQAALQPAMALEVEGIHDLRVGLRRLRAPLALFRPCLGPAAAPFNERLRQAGRVLGGARDWDVLLTETLPQVRAAGMDAGQVTALAQAIEAPSRMAKMAVQTSLAEEFAGLLPALHSWAADGARVPSLLGSADRLGHQAEAVLPALLTRLRHRVARRAKGHRHADAPALHSLRRAAKILRYAAEGVAPLYDEKQAGKLARRSKKLQDVLGVVNDAAAIPSLLAALPQPRSPELEAAIARLDAWAKARGAEARDQVTAHWHKLRDTEPFWT
jgi:CHAD domain-containing protein